MIDYNKIETWTDKELKVERDHIDKLLVLCVNEGDILREIEQAELIVVAELMKRKNIEKR